MLWRQILKKLSILQLLYKWHGMTEWHASLILVITGVMSRNSKESRRYIKVIVDLVAIGAQATGNVTRLSTIVEISKIWSKIFSNKNPINCILLHKFSLFYLILIISTIFSTFLLKKIQQFLKIIWSLYPKALMCGLWIPSQSNLLIPRLFWPMEKNAVEEFLWLKIIIPR